VNAKADAAETESAQTEPAGHDRSRPAMLWYRLVQITVTTLLWATSGSGSRAARISPRAAERSWSRTT